MPESTEGFDYCSIHIAVVGLGYVGLPLAVALAKHFPVIGLDNNSEKVSLLLQGKDPTREVGNKEFAESKIHFTSDPKELLKANFIIVAVPTPVNAAKVPDLSPIESATETIGPNLKKGTTIVLESTVYPGVTEEVFGPRLAKASGLIASKDFFLGYSPERINPGDKEHTVERIVKVVSGQNEKTLELVAFVYGKVILAGVHRAPSIRVAETAKVIENVQRDLNIALINEIARICRAEGIDVHDVLAAAKTKWNFLAYQPGIVGGHCLPEDPYYLTHRAVMKGYFPRLILAGRQVNDTIQQDVADILLLGFNRAGKVPCESKILVMGLTFKENVNDCRHSGAKAIIQELKKYGVTVFGYDPHLKPELIEKDFEVKPANFTTIEPIDGIIIFSPHNEFKKHSLADLRKHCTNSPLLFDMKRMHPATDASKEGFLYLHL